MQSDMTKKGKVGLERKKQNGLQVISLQVTCKGLELRVCLACWGNMNLAGVEGKRGIMGGEEARGITLMAFFHLSQVLHWVLASNV